MGILHQYYMKIAPKITGIIKNYGMKKDCTSISLDDIQEIYVNYTRRYYDTWLGE